MSKKNNIKFVNVKTYSGAKQVLKHLSSGIAYKSANDYRKWKIRQFNKMFKPNLSAKEKREVVAKFNKFLGINKSGKISKSRRKITLKVENGNILTPIRIRSGKRKKPNINLPRTKGVASKDWGAVWEDVKDILMEFNATGYFTDFISDLYPDWVERVKNACGLYVDDIFERLTGGQFIELCIEFLKKYGW